MSLRSTVCTADNSGFAYVKWCASASLCLCQQCTVSLRSTVCTADTSGFAYATKEPPAWISWGNVNSATLRWRFPSRGGGERYELARLRSLAVSMIGRAHRSKPPQTPTTTPVGGWLPPVSPPPATAPHPCSIFNHLRSMGCNGKGQLLSSRPLPLDATPLR